MTLSREDKLRGRIVIHLEEIEAQTASFDRVSDRLGSEGFVAAWVREGTDDQADKKGSVERAYEQIVNDLIAMVDDIEAEAFRAGLVPDPQLVARQQVPAQDREAWWRTADELGLPTEGANRSQAPSRWRRLAFYGHLDHELATELLTWSDSRNLFQHGYARRNVKRGLAVWESMHSMRKRLPEVLDGILAFRDRVVPRV